MDSTRIPEYTEKHNFVNTFLVGSLTTEAIVALSYMSSEYILFVTLEHVSYVCHFHGEVLFGKYQPHKLFQAQKKSRFTYTQCDKAVK